MTYKNWKSLRFSLLLLGGTALAVFAVPAKAYAAGFFAGFLGALGGGGGGGGGFAAFFAGFLGALGGGGGGGFFAGFLGALGGGGVGTTNLCDGAVTDTVGAAICNVVANSSDLPGLITAFAYMMGLMFAVAALFKLKDHVLNPNQTPLSDSVKRFVAGGAMFSLPIVTEAATNLLTNGTLVSYDQTGVAGSTAGGYGLDAMLVALMADLFGPVQLLLQGFGYLAGLLFIVIGISRLVKTAQEGPRGPSGLGTIMTFVIAGVLFSLDSIMGAFSESIFQDTTVYTFASLSGGGTGDAIIDDHILAVISSIIGFMTLIGWISFIRGFFILRAVAEGGGQASLMAAVTHIFGGALAVNLGPLMNAVQSTFGLSSFGITFS
jgi:hypothetical protein